MFRPLLCAVFALALGVSACENSAAPDPPVASTAPTGFIQKRVIAGAYVVVLSPNVASADVETVAKQLATRHGGTVEHVYTRAIRGFAIDISATGAAAIERDSRVVRVDQDVVMMSRPREGNRRARRGQDTSYGTVRVGGSHDGTGRRVWIIDTGIDFDHDDLNVNERLSKSFVRKGKSADDQNGHGTHVAGIIGAKNNRIGTIGVAPNATLISVRVLDKNGEGQASWIIAGVEHVLANAQSGDVANFSLGGGYLPELDDAVLRLAQSGIKIAVASGNDGADCSFSSPANVTHANIHTVSAVDDTDTFWEWSNYG
ncbi:MAG: S8 family serine peptidase, partial [bacterium]|nr:S8 family serine peptidase [Candidatus Kapabacteria bacterium]